VRLKVMVPAKVIVDLEVDKVVAKSPDGYFCLLPHHVDFVSALAPGILTYEDEGGREVSLAIDEGTLAKCSNEVLVATRFAIGRPAWSGGQAMGTGAPAVDKGGQTTGAGKPSRRMPPLPHDDAENSCRGIIVELENQFMKQLLGEEIDERRAD